MAKAEKTPAKFNVYCSRTYLLWPRLDVFSSLQVKNGSMFNLSALSLDLQNRDHVKHEFEHVKLKRDHVKLSVELPCSRAVTSSIA